ncbi:MAG: hypothetical protein H0X66_06280 [Verrucomicrobia bacterium]|nr:hypothetical protein [Verrucomicrobiota bacterium]
MMNKKGVFLVLLAIFCLIPVVGHASQTGAGKSPWVRFYQQAIRLPAAVVNFPGGLLLVGQTSVVPIPETPARAKQPDANVRFKTSTYVLLTLSVLAGPIIILLLFRKKRP